MPEQLKTTKMKSYQNLPAEKFWTNFFPYSLKNMDFGYINNLRFCWEVTVTMHGIP